MGFGAPFLLIALFALPAIWWLLHVTPPAPQQEIFPPLRLLLKIVNRQETPNRTPWWLLLLRLFIAALIIIALADPIWRPATTYLTGNSPLVLVIDNGWASVHDWDKRISVADDLVNQARKAQKLVYLVATADNDDQDIRPLNADEAAKRLHNLRPRPLPNDRLSALDKLSQAIKGDKFDSFYLCDGLQEPGDDDAFHRLIDMNSNKTHIYQSDISALIGITAVKNENGAVAIDLIRAKADGEQKLTLGAYDRQGRRIGDSEMRFEDGELTTVAAFNLPLELANDIAVIKVDEQNDVASTYLVDARNHVYRVAILSTSSHEMAQPLLSPLYYVIKALQGHDEIIMANGNNFSDDVEQLLLRNPSSLIMDDVVNMPKAIQQKLANFVENGGTLIRFAGENIAGSENDDPLLPVRLRHGERQLGGVMSWATPQKLAPFAKNGRFADLAFPEDVTVSRQILAEPSPELFDKTWVSLADGTPLITAAPRGQGMLIFVHTAADPSWSTLPLSGFFVDMMQKLVETSSVNDSEGTVKDTLLVRQPWQIIDVNGALLPAPSYVTPLVLNDETPALPSFNHPPGFYGQKDNLFAVNLLDSNSHLQPVALEQFVGKTQSMDYSGDVEKHLTGTIFAIALSLFAIDCFMVLCLGGLFPKKGKFLAVIGLSAAVFTFGAMGTPHSSSAETLSGNDAAMVQSAGKTRLAYVTTGIGEIDDTSKTGLEALSQFIQSRTTIDPGAVAGLDLDKDELAFYPLIYWPIDAQSAMPTQKSIEKINAYMRQGGTVLFDTRDQIATGMNLGGKTTPNNQRLRDVLDGLNIPELEQAPPDHVISRSFFIMPDFPGRYRGSPLWILSSAMGSNDKRPIHAGDGVSSILITANDLAGAWAHDGKGAWKYPLIPDDQMQRVWAFRGGLNIVMYILTGNYKADQVHVPALLDRLGQEKAK